LGFVFEVIKLTVTMMIMIPLVLVFFPLGIE